MIERERERERARGRDREKEWDRSEETEGEREGWRERKESERYLDGEFARCNVLFHKTSSTEKLLLVTHAVQRAL